MKDMNLFGDAPVTNQNSFEEALNDLILEVVPAYNGFEYKIKELNPYLKSLWEFGNLKRSEALDKLIRLCYTRCSDEYDVQRVFLHGAAECFKYGATPEEVITLNLWEVQAIARLHDYEKPEEVDIHKEIRLARLLPANEEDLVRICKVAGLNRNFFNNYGLVLLKLKTKIEPCYEIVMKNVDANPEWDCFDVLNFAHLLRLTYEQTGTYLEKKALLLLLPIVGKKFTTDAVTAMISAFGCILSYYPCTNLSHLVLMRESAEGMNGNQVSHLYTKLETFVNKKSQILNCEPDYVLAVINSVYDTGFTAQFLQKGCEHFFEEAFLKLIDCALQINEAARKCYHVADYSRPIKSARVNYSASYHYNNVKEYYVIKPEILLDELRIIYTRMELDADLQLTYLDTHWRYSQAAMINWLMSRNDSTSLNRNDITRCVKEPYSEIQIAFNGEIIYQLPEDFFIEYEDELTSWYNATNLAYYTVSSVPGINKDTKTLIIAFSNDKNTSVITRTNPLAVTVSLETKKELLFSHDYRYDMPVLKMMLYEYFVKHNKSTDVIKTLDMQTVVGMIQVLVLQNSKSYETLFNRPDSFLSGFKALKYCLRSDDDFNSAVLRYVINVSGIYSKFFNNKLSNSLQDYVVIDNKELPILGILVRDRSLVECLQERKGKGTVSIEIKEDVVHFD